MEKLLQETAENTRETAANTAPKESFQIILSDNKTEFTTRFSPRIELARGKKYEIAPVNLETYYFFPNIARGNNIFTCSPDGGNSWFKIAIPEGCYDIVDINDAIHREMERNEHYDPINEQYYVNISANMNTLKAVLILENNYHVDFNHPSSISKVLGFNHAKFVEGFHESENIVNIISINSVLVNIDNIRGSYIRNTRQNTIYSFFRNVSPGYKIVETPRNLVYLPIITDEIDEFYGTLRDQDGVLLNLRGKKLTMRFYIREA